MLLDLQIPSNEYTVEVGTFLGKRPFEGLRRWDDGI
jgi:hypothetical protein